MILLETERLYLRHFVREDLDEVYRLLYEDLEVKRTWSTVTGTAEEIKGRFAQRYIENQGDFGLRAIVLKENQALLGLMGFQRHGPAQGQEIYYLLTQSAPNRSVSMDPNCIEVELTYALGRPYWKHGYALEMGKAMIVYGFERLEIGRIIQGVLSSNLNSINLMRRLGFHIEAGLDPDQTVGILEDYASWRKSFVEGVSLGSNG